MDRKVITKKQDLTYLNWTKIRNSSGTAGSFLKAYSELTGKKIYYKLSNFDSHKGIIGHECVNEIIVDRLLTILGIKHLAYQLIYADIVVAGNRYTTWVCASEDYKQKNETKMALDAYYQMECNRGESPMNFCIRCGWERYIYEMIVVDFLILNRDRHGANIEVLRDSAKKTFRIAPLFDHGLSLVFPCVDEDMLETYHPLDDKAVQCFVGGRSAKDNLELIPKDKLPKLQPLKLTDRKILFADLEQALPVPWQDKIWEMIRKRWNYYEDFCNQR